MDDLPAWDDSERPPVVTYADPSPYARMSRDHLRAIHDGYRHALATVVQAADDAVEGRASVGQLREAIHEAGLSRHYQRLSSYCGQLCSAVTQHHTIEDVVFRPQLRAADVALHATLDRIALEHGVVHELLERIDRRARVFATDPGELDLLVAELHHLRTLLLSHFSYEEEAVGTALGQHGIGV